MLSVLLSRARLQKVSALPKMLLVSQDMESLAGLMLTMLCRINNEGPPTCVTVGFDHPDELAKDVPLLVKFVVVEFIMDEFCKAELLAIGLEDDCS